MIDVYNAKEILEIKFWDTLFSKQADKAKTEFRMLCKIWHPDKNKDAEAADVFAHLTDLYSQIGSKAASSNPSFSFVAKTKETFTFPYYFTDSFEMGKVYFDRARIFYVYEKENSSYIKRGLRNLEEIVSAINEADHLKKASRESLFNPNAVYETENEEVVVVYERKLPFIRLTDLLHEKTIVDQKHVAWIMSRLSNLTCLLQACGFTHNAIVLDNCFIDAAQHKVFLLGGWEYSLREGALFDMACSEIFRVLPQATKERKKATITTDLEGIKNLGRFLTKGQRLPSPFREWLWRETQPNAIGEFRAWDEALDEAFGKRSFIHLDVRDEEIFKR